MSVTYIPENLRRQVRARASNACEFCGLVELGGWIKHQIDHVIAEKHGGPTILENLALACVDCNLYKGTDLSSIKWPEEEIINLFNPRKDTWGNHFSILPDAKIDTLTTIGEVTAHLLRFNDKVRIAMRKA